VHDGAWAVLASRARLWLATDPGRLVRASLASGLVMVALGLLLLAG
jgi:threonine/homoserine/homoserine lactone efflux protein